MTAIAEAFEKKGVAPKLAKLRVALSEFINHGGTTAEIRAEADAIDRMSGMGHTERAVDGHPGHAQTRQQVEGGEAGAVVPKGHVTFASSPSSNRGGDGHFAVASSGQHRNAIPVREPSVSYLKAVGEARMESARHILYRHKTSTGHWWGDIHPYEVAGMTRDSVRGLALMSALGPLNTKQMGMTFSQLLTPKQAEIAMDKADREIAHVTG